MEVLNFLAKKFTLSKTKVRSELNSIENVAKLMKSRSQNSDIVLDDLPLILNSETQHLLVCGDPYGMGRTQLIFKLLSQCA